MKKIFKKISFIISGFILLTILIFSIYTDFHEIHKHKHKQLHHEKITNRD